MKPTNHISRTLLLAGLLGLCLAPIQADQQQGGDLESRHVPLDGQPNFRDLGGYETVDGRKVKWGQVFRSGELPRLSEGDIEQLEKLHIRTVVNFLTETEISLRGEDHLPDDVRSVLLPIKGEITDDLLVAVLAARQTGDFSGIPPEANREIHHLLMDEGREYYAALLRELTDSANRPLVFHCSHGIHRTGTAAAILLSALGVPWDTVREDYLLSNLARKEEIALRIDQLKSLDAETRGISPDEIDTTNLEAFYILQGSYIDASLAAATEEFGSMDVYIRKGLGLSDAEIQRLREELLDE
jgi:protein-tyrosine phosphatase